MATRTCQLALLAIIETDVISIAIKGHFESALSVVQSDMWPWSVAALKWYRLLPHFSPHYPHHHQRHPIPSNSLSLHRSSRVSSPLSPPTTPPPPSLRFRTLIPSAVALTAATATALRITPYRSCPLLRPRSCLRSSLQLPRPGRAPSLPPPATGLPSNTLPPLHPRTFATQTDRQTDTHTHSHANKLIHAPLTKHTWTHTLTLAPNYQQPQAQFRSSSVLHLQNHTTPAFAQSTSSAQSPYSTRHPTCTSLAPTPLRADPLVRTTDSESPIASYTAST
jgi:hypothetical protein